MTTRRRKRRGALLIGFAILAYAIVAVFQWLDTPMAQRRLVAWLSRHSSWEIQVDHWEWRPLSHTLRIVDLSLRHRSTGQTLRAEHCFLHYNPWVLPAGRFRIRELLIDGVVGDFSHMPPPRKARQPITFRKLLVVQNLTVDAATVTDVDLALPRNHRLRAARVWLQLKSSLVGDARLLVQVDATRFTADDEEVASLGQLTFAGATNVARWVNAAPFVNAAKGALTLASGRWHGITIVDLASVVSFNHSRFGLDDLHALINGQPLMGSGHLDLEEQTYAAELKWPRPMPMPEFLGADQLFLTAGTIQGTIAAKGRGFDPATSVGEGRVDLTQVPAALTTIPCRVTAKANWDHGTLTLRDARLAMGDGQVQVTGGFDARERRLRLQFRGSRLPLEAVFSRFADSNFHPIRGVATVEGSFTGWGREYLLDLRAEAQPGSYYDIAVERAAIRLRLTYPRLELNGQVQQGGRTTAQTDLTITYGPKLGSQPRSKQLRLTTRIARHDLGPSFAAYRLAGMGNGSLTLTGTPQNFRAAGQAEILDGAFYAIPLKRVTSQIAIAPRRITYAQGSIELPTAPPLLFSQPITMEITPEGFRLSGTPRPGVNLDVGYQSAHHTWTVRSLSYTDPAFPDRRLTVTGTGAAGNWNLGIRGIGNLGLLEYLPARVRGAAGPIALDLRLAGPLDAPNLQGTARLHGAALLLRDLPYELEALEGTLRFLGHEIRCDPLTGRVGDGTFTLTGGVTQTGLAVAGYDLRLRGVGLHIASLDRHFRAEVDADVTWRGAPARSVVAGDVTILDAKYDKDFHILEQVREGGAAEAHEELRRIAEGWERIGLDLRVRSTGDIWIRNNAADVALRADTGVGGSLAHPQARGAIDVTEGKLHYLGLNFEVSHGIVEFHAPYAHPYIEMTGEKDVREYLIQLTLRGPTDNLTLDLSATPGLERKDILALLAFGATQEELRTAQFGAQVGPSIFLEQVGKLVERPLSKLTGLDVVRVETQTGIGGGAEGSRLYLGKRVSDRLAVEFMTGVNEQTSEQGFQVEYNLTDHLLLKAAQPAGQKTRVNLSVRFRER